VQRLLTAVALLPIICAVVGWGNPAMFCALTAGIALLGILEMARLAERCGGHVDLVLASGLGLGACAAFLDPPRAGAWILALLAFTCCASLVRSVVRPADGCGAFGAVAATLFAGVYPGVLLAFMVGLRMEPQGRAVVFFIVVVIWVSDTAAYYLGRAFGRHLLCPRISPKKTVEGAVAGVLAAAAAAEACRLSFYPDLGPAAAAIGAALAGIGILGDLGESILKRGAGVKDTATLLPGHGGMLDRIDSLLLAGPVFYYYYHSALR
jgi:phosphatidate cytidylyltransferase